MSARKNRQQAYRRDIVRRNMDKRLVKLAMNDLSKELGGVPRSQWSENEFLDLFIDYFAEGEVWRQFAESGS